LKRDEHEKKMEKVAFCAADVLPTWAYNFLHIFSWCSKVALHMDKIDIQWLTAVFRSSSAQSRTSLV